MGKLQNYHAFHWTRYLNYTSVYDAAIAHRYGEIQYKYAVQCCYSVQQGTGGMQQTHCCINNGGMHFLAPSPVSAAGRKCGYIYKGFAECLLRLGDSMTESVQQGGEELLEIDAVCRSWDEFHRCASAALAGCPEEAAVVWESLRQESRKMQFSGNLYDMCSNRAKPSTSVQSPNQEETNQESLRGSAYLPSPAHFLALSLAALVVRM